jgi:hypothetical protein
MAVAGLWIAIAVGAPNTTGAPLIVSAIIAFVGNPIVGALGALFGIVVVERVGERVKSPLIR